MNSHSNRPRYSPGIGLAAALCLLGLGLAAGCSDRQGEAERSAAQRSGGDSGLPAPEGVRGSVTGMPDAPGPGTVAPADGTIVDGTTADGMVAPDGAIVIEDGAGTLPELPADFGSGLTVDPGLAQASQPPAPPATPSPEEAVSVIRNYYGAINARRFDNAYALWADGGGASGQSPGQFADGFARTAGLSVEIDAPGRMQGAGDDRLIEVPVSVAATTRDGARRYYRGAYTLRDAGQGWRIAAADIREVQP